MKVLNFKHSGHLGDIIYSIPAVKKIMLENGCEKANFYLPRNKPYIPPNENQHHICGEFWISENMYKFLDPLLRSQPYINEIYFIEENKLPGSVIDLDFPRLKGLINYAAGNLQDYYFKAFGLFNTENDKWLYLDLEDNIGEELNIVIGRSTRYNNVTINYSLLSSSEIPIKFIGTDIECNYFKNDFPKLNFTYVKVQNSLEAAKIISQSSIYIGNQSFFFSIAEGLKVPRLLESCELCPNVIPIGSNSGQFVTNHGLVKLINTFFRAPIIPIENLSLEIPKYIFGRPLINI